nr:hypothetical protein [uncultured Comamonas sp.]
METKLINGKQPRVNDDKILAAVTNKATGDIDGNVMTLGVRNEDGQIYRVFFTTGLREFQRAIGALKNLGFRDELADSFNMKEGCDAIFNR